MNLHPKFDFSSPGTPFLSLKFPDMDSRIRLRALPAARDRAVTLAVRITGRVIPTSKDVGYEF